MQLSANFLIDSNSFFKEQFLLSKNFYNQGRYLINEQYNENKTFINADINGALNILRKYLHLKEVNEFSVVQKIIDRGLLFRPYRISFY